MIHNPDLPFPADVIPHRPPRLWISGVTELIPGTSAKGFWLPGDSQFEGHFDGAHVLQGVQQVEALAQLGGYAIMSENPGAYDVALDEHHSVHPSLVLPGDEIELSIEIVERGKREFTGLGEARVLGELVSVSMVTGRIMRTGMLSRAISAKVAERAHMRAQATNT